jgi:hypothetical protein
VNDAALGALHELHELAHEGVSAQLGLDSRDGGTGGQPGAVQDVESRAHLTPSRRIDAAAPHADDIHGHGPRGDAVGDHEGRHVLGDLGEAADVGVGPDPHERMQAGVPAHRGPVLHDHVPGESSVVDDDDLVADHAVVGDVARGHDEAALSDPCVVPFVGRAVHGDVFAD